MAEFKNAINLINKQGTLLNSIFLDNKCDFKNEYSKDIIENEKLIESLDSNLKLKLIEECRHMFDNHYIIAIELLDTLINENSEYEAVSSLRSILNLMKESLL